MQIGGFTDVIGTGRNDKFYTVGQCGEPVEQAIVRIGQMVKPDQDDQDMRIVLRGATFRTAHARGHPYRFV